MIGVLILYGVVFIMYLLFKNLWWVLLIEMLVGCMYVVLWLVCILYMVGVVFLELVIII